MVSLRQVFSSWRSKDITLSKIDKIIFETPKARPRKKMKISSGGYSYLSFAGISSKIRLMENAKKQLQNFTKLLTQKLIKKNKLTCP